MQPYMTLLQARLRQLAVRLEAGDGITIAVAFLVSQEPHLLRASHTDHQEVVVPAQIPQENLTEMARALAGDTELVENRISVVYRHRNFPCFVVRRADSCVA